MVAEFLALVNVGDVHLDGRQLHREDRVEDRDRGRGVAGRIDDDARRLLALGVVKGIDDLALVVRLAEVHLEAEALRGVAAQRLDVGQRRMPVFLRLARPERIQVRTIEDVDRCHNYCARAASIFWPSVVSPTAPTTRSLLIT